MNPRKKLLLSIIALLIIIGIGIASYTSLAQTSTARLAVSVYSFAKPYDALVYLTDSGEAVAIDKNGQIIAGPSTNHSYVIQVAIDNGNNVFLRGTFVISTPIILKSNLVIEGDGETTLRLADGANTPILTIMSNVENVTIRGIRFDGNKDRQTTWMALLQLQNSGLGYIVKNVIVENNYIMNSIGDGIFIIGEDVIVRNNYFINIADTALVFGGYTPNGEGLVTRRAIAEGNIFINCTIGVDASNNAEYITIAQNIFNATTGKQIRLTYTANGNKIPSHVSIVNNKIITTTTTEDVIVIVYDNGEDIKIIGNTIIGGRQGIIARGKDVIVAENYVEDCYWHGIVIASNGIIAIGNTVKNCDQGNVGAQGIRIEANYTLIAFNHVYDDQATKTQDRGIQEASGVDYNTIAYNNVRDNAVIGILRVGSNTRVENNIGYKTENKGVAAFSGDGVTTTFTIPHGLATTPSYVKVTPGSADAAGSFYVTVDSTYIYVHYLTAPPAGTDNIVLYWEAKA